MPQPRIFPWKFKHLAVHMDHRKDGDVERNSSSSSSITGILLRRAIKNHHQVLMYCILVTEGSAIEPPVRELTQNYLNPTGLEINMKMPRLSELSQSPLFSTHQK